MRRNLVPLAALFMTTPLCLAAQEIADTIYQGGPILTMEDDLPRAQALAVKDGRIIAVGSAKDISQHNGADTRIVDLDGKALLPGFVDAHGHVFAVGLQAMAANLLAAPDGTVNDIPSLQRVLTEYAAQNADRVKAVNAIIGFGYDDSQLAEQRHPTREDLDAVSTDIPIYVIHQSGHLGVANSPALALAGLTPESKEMPGGVIRRGEDGKTPNGVLEETPHFAALLAVLQNLDTDGSMTIFRAGTELVASYGYTTAQEGRATTGQAQLMAAVAASSEGLKIDVVAYPDVLVDRDFIAQSVSRDYENRFRVGGAKLTIDGSPQGFTALRDRPYYKPPAHFRADYAGYSAASPDQVFDAIDWAFDNDIQILTHSNGEGASDMLIAAIKTAAEKHGNDDRRAVLIHGQFLREDQVDAVKRLDMFPSLFPMHTFYWGDWHRERTVGPINAENISPTGWVMERGMKFSTHHDAPVAFPDSMRVLDATVTRRSRSGDIIGARHRVDVMTALKAMTIWPAWQHFEEDHKGSLAPGKLADLIILSQDPTAVDPETLDQIKVLKTIKEDVVIFERGPDDTRQGQLNWRPPAHMADPVSEMLRAAAASHSHGPGSAHSAACASGFLTAALAPMFDRVAGTLPASN
ncbi:amidohydrolase [Seohaeicola saemankumensis]|nr:amidohydrolase [Seohaeicola saemankumensis]MCA0870856.1 amidohydrolase [Seohaeicola saemankumensis]